MKQTRLRRFAAIGLVYTLLMLLFISPVSAAGVGTVKMADAVTAPNQTVAVTLSLESNPGLWGIRLEVGYDHNSLKLQRVEAGTIFTANEITPPPDLEQEKYRFMADKTGLANATGDGTLVTLFFAVDGEAALKEYPVTLTLVDAIDVDGNTVELNCNAGKITVVNCLHDGEKTVVNAKEATFKEEGYTGDTKCNDCGVILETGKVIPIIKCLHDKGTTVVDAKDATETEEGYTGDTKCNDCGKIIESGKVIPKLTPKPEESNPSQLDIPQTGDNSAILPIALIALASGTVLVVLDKKRTMFKHK